MKRVSNRAGIAVVLSSVLAVGLFVFVFRFLSGGAAWAVFPSNSHIYSNGVLLSGKILDRKGELLLDTQDGRRVYNPSPSVRKATLHAVGDTAGNISSGAQTAFASKLAGYDLLNGLYSFGSGGDNLYLTLDSKLCETADNALNGRSGAVAVYNYKTGELLCMVSSPNYDPADPPEIAEGDSRYKGAYINKFLSASFVPGSVFKLVAAAAAIDAIGDIDSRTFTCAGSADMDGETITCSGMHGTIDFETALAESCNVAFAEITTQLGADTLLRYARRTGMLDSISVDGIKTAAGSVDLENVTGAQLAWSGIGQYGDLVNPCAMLAYVGAIANGGRPVYPHLIYKVTNALGIPVSVMKKTAGEPMLSASTARTLSNMMHYNVTENYGEDSFPGLDLCAKSGTAEVGGGLAPHAWFVGFLRGNEHPYAFVVLVENGGGGMSVAGAVANTVLQAAVGGK